MEKSIQALTSEPRLRYCAEGRGGTIRYESVAACFEMWYEFANGTALAIIGVPAVAHWEAHTKIPLSQREAVLRFIGEQIIHDKLHGDGYFRTDDFNILTIYSGRQ